MLDFHIYSKLELTRAQAPKSLSPRHAASEGSAGLAKPPLHLDLSFCHSQTVSKAEQAAPDTACARRAVRRADWQHCFSASEAPGLISLSKA